MMLLQINVSLHTPENLHAGVDGDHAGRDRDLACVDGDLCGCGTVTPNSS
jgi:hypothetical protein